jgi:SAM-dependent methyltransferase
MTWLDRYGQRLRIRRARAYIPAGAKVLDVGCGDGELFRQLEDVIGAGVGIDPLAPAASSSRFRFVRGLFPADFNSEEEFDVVVGLAVFEHLEPPEQAALADACHRCLRPGGRVILTIPSPVVDPILHVLQRLRLGDAETLHEHHGFDPAQTAAIFERAGFSLHVRRHFELLLNNLFVFTKSEGKAQPTARADRQHGA